jgi:adenylate cyclase
VFYPQLIGMRAVAYAQAGQPAEGLKLIEGLLAGMDEERVLRELPPVLLLRGELLLAVSPENASEAARIFRAIQASQGNVGGKIVALQAATRLCKLEMHSEESDQGCRVLAEIYEGFTEGFETADLRAARAVLDEWRG